MTDVAVVILNWNGKEFLEKFLPGVVEHSGNAQVVVADNASDDGSVAMLRQCFPQIRIISLDKNYGFAGGYQHALKDVQARYYVLLNSDIEVTPAWLKPMYSLLEENEAVAAVQPKILSYHRKNMFEYAGAAGGYIDRYGYPFCRGRIFGDVEEDKGQYDDVCDIFWATGACMMVRSDIYHKVGGLDPKFFAHMEEIDLCWRMQHYGYRIMYTPESKVYHIGGGTLPPNSPFKVYLNFRNSLYLLYKNLPPEKKEQLLKARKKLDMLAASRFLMAFNYQSYKAVFKGHREFEKIKSTLAFVEGRCSGVVESQTYPGSIVVDYFIHQRKKFTQLKWKK
ncbi:MAG: glycosyltransferase family 2 protein [Bacteroidota bacterium]